MIYTVRTEFMLAEDRDRFDRELEGDDGDPGPGLEGMGGEEVYVRR